jgi:hypothetical protein
MPKTNASPIVRGHAQRSINHGRGRRQAACSCGWTDPDYERGNWAFLVERHNQHKAEVLGVDKIVFVEREVGKSTEERDGSFTLTPENLRKAYMTAWALFGSSSKDLAVDLQCQPREATAAMRKLEELGCITEEHVNGARDIVWQVTLQSIDYTDEPGAWKEITEKLGLPPTTSPQQQEEAAAK